MGTRLISTYVKVEYYLSGNKCVVILNTENISEIEVASRCVVMTNGNAYALTPEGYELLMTALDALEMI